MTSTGWNFFPATYRLIDINGSKLASTDTFDLGPTTETSSSSPAPLSCIARCALPDKIVFIFVYAKLN